MLFHYHHPGLFLTLQTHQSSSFLPPLLFINGGRMSRLERGISSFQLLRHRAVERESSSSSSSSSSEEEEEDEFEVEPDKARKALQELDQQLLSLSRKQITRPKIRAKDMDRPQPRVREEVPDFSGSFLAYTAFGLLLFTIFYNVIFITVIKPSIDFPEAVEATSVQKAPVAE